ncbi:MAG: GNAT family N-acetyltransferase [Bauldia sp.]|nr:GNAT family N-acetyltransferase [Bauldia sp.]
MPKKPTPTPSLAFRSIGRDDWPEVERLFMAPGGPKYCWCMVWRGDAAERRGWPGAATKAGKRGELSEAGKLRRAALKKRVEAGEPVGLLAYDGDEPVGWVSVAPRPTYERLKGPDDHADAPQKVWSVVCFYLKRAFRGAGQGNAMIEAAIAAAKAGGAAVLEAYPVQPDSPSYRFMGFVPAFARAGFREVAPAGSRRTVMRLEL